MAKLGCVSMLLGIAATLAAVATRLGHCTLMGLGPRSFAAGAALMLLLSIASHACAAVCCAKAPGK